MSATFTWSITKMECLPQESDQTDVVIIANWQCFGVQNKNGINYFDDQTSSSFFTYSQGNPFTPYNQLTEEQVLSWVWASGVNKNDVESSIQQQINNQINPTVINPPLPWTQ